MKLDEYAKRADEFYTKERAKSYSDDTDYHIESGSFYESPRVLHTKEVFEKVCSNFKKATILDLGCGEGRYFHLLSNYSKIYGLDASKQMIFNAKRKFAGNDNIELNVGNLYEFDNSMKYDFIYSIGVLAEHSPLNLLLLNKVYDSLNSDGYFFFTTTTPSSYYLRMRSFVARFLHVFTNIIISNSSINRKLLQSYMSKSNVKTLIKETEFKILSSKNVNNKGSHVDQTFWLLRK